MAEDLDGQLPKQELLVKILNMTTSDNDNTALVAIRRANEFLAKQNWSWEKLIQAKIKIVEDPFKNLNNVPEPKSNRYTGRPAPPPPPPPPQPAQQPWRPQPRPTTKPAAPQTPPKPQRPHSPLGTRSNLYGGHCWCCGDPVDPKAGWLFDPSDHNRFASNQGKLKIVCHSCNTAAYPNIGTSPATRRRATSGKAPSLGDI